jgi:hypothetical protein
MYINVCVYNYLYLYIRTCTGSIHRGMLNAYARVNKGKLISIHPDDKKGCKYKSTFGHIIENTHQEFLSKNSTKKRSDGSAKKEKRRIFRKRKKKILIDSTVYYEKNNTKNINDYNNKNISNFNIDKKHDHEDKNNIHRNNRYNHTKHDMNDGNRSHSQKLEKPTFYVKIDNVRLSALLVDAVLSSLKAGTYI